MEDSMSRLTHDLIAEVLSRVPYKQLCICKCVSLAWRDIIADPAYGKKIAQSLVGFFYETFSEATDNSLEPRGIAVNYADLSAFSWASVPRTSPRLLLPPDSTDCFFSLEDSGDGLFLTRIREGAPELIFRYIVSNPSTGEYTVLPHSGYAGNCCGSYLGFDSGVSTEEFRVFEFVEEWLEEFAHPPVVRGLKIYSSKTGVWVSMEIQWDMEVSLCCCKLGVFHKGYLHVLIHDFGLAIVDAEGLNWRTIRGPNSEFIDPSRSGFIGKSAGQLIYINSDNAYCLNRISTISVYALSVEVYHWGVSHLDYESVHWKLLHKKKFRLGLNPIVIGVHPHANMIFITDSNNELLAYDMDHRESTTVYHIQHDYQRSRQFFHMCHCRPPYHWMEECSWQLHIDMERDVMSLDRILVGTLELRFRYIVSNPSTSEYSMLPHSGYADYCCSSYMGFDSAVFTEEWPDNNETWNPHPLVMRGVNILLFKSWGMGVDGEQIGYRSWLVFWSTQNFPSGVSALAQTIGWVGNS